MRSRPGEFLMAELDSRPTPRPSGARFVAAALVAALLFGVLAARLFQLQVVEGARYAARAVSASTVTVAIPAPRGLIFDRQGRPGAVNTPSWTLYARPADLPKDVSQRNAVLARAAGIARVDLPGVLHRLASVSG